MSVYRYEEVRITQVDHLASVQFGVDDETMEKLCKINEKIDAYASGDLKHAGEAVSLLWEVLEKRRDSPPVHSSSASLLSPHPRPTSPATSTPTNWENVKIALIRSIREGVFVDLKYWARRSRAGQVLQPVYLSSIVAGQRLSYIDIRKRLDPA